MYFRVFYPYYVYMYPFINHKYTYIQFVFENNGWFEQSVLCEPSPGNGYLIMQKYIIKNFCLTKSYSLLVTYPMFIKQPDLYNVHVHNYNIIYFMQMLDVHILFSLGASFQLAAPLKYSHNAWTNGMLLWNAAKMVVWNAWIMW